MDERKSVPEKLTFSMHYFYNERHLLPLSHDEVVHGKKTIIDKIYTDHQLKLLAKERDPMGDDGSSCAL